MNREFSHRERVAEEAFLLHTYVMCRVVEFFHPPCAQSGTPGPGCGDDFDADLGEYACFVKAVSCCPRSVSDMYREETRDTRAAIPQLPILLPFLSPRNQKYDMTRQQLDDGEQGRRQENSAVSAHVSHNGRRRRALDQQD